MTGIIAAVTSKNEIAPIILKGLKKIQSRNHEVSGISLLSKNKFNSIKTSGNIELLNKTTKKITSKIGIAYTGWLYGEDIKSLSQ